MGLEGNLRELALQEVLQLLAHTRKSGELCINAPLSGLNATIAFENGAIVNASIAGLVAEETLATTQSPQDPSHVVESAVLELLSWQDGIFSFQPVTDRKERLHTGVRLNADALLMEGARRVDMWNRLSDRLPHPRVVPAFVDVESRSLPLLNLTPAQWEVLTGVDGQRDLLALSRTLGRDLIETAETVYGLIETGLLCVNDPSRAARAYATPPSMAHVATRFDDDLWVPEQGDLLHTGSFSGDDEIFDPVRVGVITHDGLPRLRTPATSGVALVSHERKLGDDAARRGDLAAALAHWSAVLDTERDGPDADHAREAIALAVRLSEMLGDGQ